jgi:hypothetical protein
MTCPRSFKYHYVDKLLPLTHSGALYFGSAIDKALNELLVPTGESTPEAIFLEEFSKDNKMLDLHVVYANSDFDGDLLSEEDLVQIKSFMSSSGLRVQDPIAAYKMLALRKSNAGLECLSEAERMLYNMTNWLCLKQKGAIILRDYAKTIIPTLKQVIKVQIEINHPIDNEVTINGFIDFIAETQDGKVVLFDNKTSGSLYEKDSVRNSPQLALYKEAIKKTNPELNITHAGFIVMSKRIKKNTVKKCATCGNISEGRHKTCNATKEDGSRCGGEWLESLSPEASFQIIIDEIPQSYKDIVIENYNEVHAGIVKQVFPRNLSKCDDTYGGMCVYKKYCLKGDTNGLKKEVE